MLSESQVRSRISHAGKLPRIYFLFVCDFLVSLTGYVLAASAIEGSFDLYWLSVNENVWLFLLLVILAMQASLLVEGLYWQPQPRSRIALALSLAQAQGASLLMAAVLGYLVPGWRLSLLLMALSVIFNLVLLFSWRLLFRAIFWGAPEFLRILFVGTGPVTQELAAHLTAQPELKFEVLGFLEEAGREPEGIAREKLLGAPASLAEQVVRLRPDSVVVGMEDARDRLPVAALLALRSTGVPIEEVTELYEAVFGRVSAAALRPHDLIFRRDFGARPGGVALQSIYVNLVALAGIVALFPALAAIALAIRLTSRGPVFDRTRCLGFEGLPFLRLKFRCREDGRLTPLGGWLRRSGVEKLPELVNVLRGEMSLVGPRPHRAEFAQVLASLYPYYSQRQIVKPGIVGWAQINMKGEPETVDELTALEYDLYYIKHLSPALDLYILVHSLV